MAFYRFTLVYISDRPKIVSKAETRAEIKIGIEKVATIKIRVPTSLIRVFFCKFISANKKKVAISL